VSTEYGVATSHGFRQPLHTLPAPPLSEKICSAIKSPGIWQPCIEGFCGLAQSSSSSFRRGCTAREPDELIDVTMLGDIECRHNVSNVQCAMCNVQCAMCEKEHRPEKRNMLSSRSYNCVETVAHQLSSLDERFLRHELHCAIRRRASAWASRL
jgi:hypothetical protein